MSLKYYKLSEICDIEKGKTGISKAKEGQYPLIATAAEFKSSDKYDFDGRAVCIPLVSSTGHGHASINRLHYYDGKFALGTILAKVTSKDENVVDTKYLYIYLSFFKDEVLVPLMKGSANVSLTVTSLKKLEVPVPSIDVQRKIKDLYSSVNPLSALVNDKHNNQFESIPRLREKILDLAVRGLLVPQEPSDEPASVLLENIEKEKKRLIKEKVIKKSKPLPPIKKEEIPFELPEGWEWVRLEDISLIEMGQSPKGDTVNENDGVEFHQGKTYFGNKYLRHSGKYTLDPKKFAKENNVLLSVRAPVGTLNITDRHICIGRGLCAIAGLSGIAKELYFYFISALEDYLHMRASGTTFVAVTATVVRMMPIPLPPLNEQQRIIKRVEKLMTLCDELELEVNESKKNSKLLMKAVLNEAFEH